MAFVEFTSKGKHTFNYTFGQATVEDGKSYVMHESWVGQVPGSISLLENQFRQYNIKEDANGKSILFMRTMGGGDMLFLSALIHYVKEKYPESKIGFACINEQSEIPKMIDGVERVYAFPLESSIFHQFDYHFEVSGLLEGKSGNHDRNAYDVYFEHLGVEVDENGIALIEESYKRPKIVKKHIDKITKNDKLVGIHPFAHDPIRQFDPYVTSELCKRLILNGYDVVMFGSKQEKEVYEFLFPNARWVSGESMEQSCLIAASCSILIGCDSLMIHLAQGIGVRTIALYGPFDPETRVKYYNNIDVIDTNPHCRCKLHSVGQCPKGFRSSPCMNIDPDIIIDLIKGTDNYTYTGELNTTVSEYNLHPSVNKPVIEGDSNVTQG